MLTFPVFLLLYINWFFFSPLLGEKEWQEVHKTRPGREEKGKAGLVFVLFGWRCVPMASAERVRCLGDLSEEQRKSIFGDPNSSLSIRRASRRFFEEFGINIDYDTMRRLMTNLMRKRKRRIALFSCLQGGHTRRQGRRAPAHLIMMGR